MGALLEVKQSSAMQDKPLLDEESFQQLLAAAYVIQQHNESAPVEEIRPSQTSTLAEIVEIQSLIQSHQLDLNAAMNLIATRAQKLTRASGAAIATVQGEELHYCAGSGSAATATGTRIPLHSSLSTECVTRRELVQSPNLETEKNLRVPSASFARKVRSLIAIPFFYDGNVAGVLELHSGHPNCFQEHDVRTCQLMAGLLSEAFARNAELEWKSALVAERATMLEALEKIKPQLEKLVEAAPTPKPVAVEPESPVEAAAVHCRGCGNELLEEESYCGICGAARASGVDDIQSKWASMWHMQQAQQQHQLDFSNERAIELSPAEPSGPAAATEPVIDVEAEPLHGAHQVRIVPDEVAPAETTSSPWSSATKARKWLESQRPSREWLLYHWHFNRANIYLGVSVLLLLVVLTGLGSRSARNYFGQTASASTKNGKHPAGRQLSLFERALVATGIAEAPPQSVYLGNPEAKVWVDLHTALYYCQGTDPYGKTPGGKFVTQLEAQQDQFEPAFRKACD